MNKGEIQHSGNFRASLFLTGAIAAISLASSPARAAFHLWNVTEVYSNSSGSLQFIELSDTSGGQNFVGGQSINIVSGDGNTTHHFSLPAGSLSGSTLNHHLLFGTAGIQAAGAPKPDYIIPDGFLFTDGGTLSFFGANGGGYAALPIDGTLSRNWNDGTSVNSPQNFAGAVGQIVVPEPATAGVLAACTTGAFLGLRRRGQK